jgi:hypothetical protein
MSTEFTYTEAKFTFKQTCATQIPTGSVLFVEVPSQVIVENTVSVVGSCGPISKMSEDMVCEITANTLEDSQELDGTHTIRISGGFENQLERNDEMVFEIKRGIVTPISTETTDSFKIYVQDSEGYMINYITEALTITMLHGKEIETVKVEPTSYRVGDQADYTIEFITTVPIRAGFKL